MSVPDPRPPAPGYVEHLVDFYDAFASQYDAWAGGLHRRVAGRLAGLAGARPGETILDVGAGTGLVTHQVAVAAGRRGQVIGIDLSEGMLQVARRRARANTRFIGMPAERLIFRDATFDLVTYGLSLSLLVDPRASLDEAHRVLRPGGRIAVASLRRSLDTEAQATFYRLVGTLLRDHPLRVPEPPAGREDFGEPDMQRRLLEEAGFELVEVVEMVTGWRTRDASEWVDVMAGSGPLPHTLITALGPLLRTRLEADLVAALEPLGEDAYRHHHAFSFALGVKPFRDAAEGGGAAGQDREPRTASGSIA